MEEDIKILEELIEEYNASYPEEKEWVAIYPNQIQAIQNLIARYKELENFKEEYKKEINLNTEIRKLKERIKDLEETNACLHETAKDEFIPKSKVKEKIEYKKEKLNNLEYSSDRYRRTCLQAEIDFGEELLED